MVFQKKRKFWTFWEILLIRLHFASNWLLLAVFKETQDFFSKNQSFFLKKKPLFHFSTFWEILLNNLHPTTIFFYLRRFLKKSFYFEKPIYFTLGNQILKKFCSGRTHLFFSKQQIFYRFEDSYLFSCIVVQVCYLFQFFEK